MGSLLHLVILYNLLLNITNYTFLKLHLPQCYNFNYYLYVYNFNINIDSKIISKRTATKSTINPYVNSEHYKYKLKKVVPPFGIR